jgi:hypothetical protein
MMNQRKVKKIEAALRIAAEHIDKHFKLENCHKTRVMRDVTEPNTYSWTLEIDYYNWVTVTAGDKKIMFNRSGSGCLNGMDFDSDGNMNYEELAESIGWVGTEVKLAKAVS